MNERFHFFLQIRQQLFKFIQLRLHHTKPFHKVLSLLTVIQVTIKFNDCIKNKRLCQMQVILLNNKPYNHVMNEFIKCLKSYFYFLFFTE